MVYATSRDSARHSTNLRLMARQGALRYVAKPESDGGLGVAEGPI